jgi:DNA polymerase IV (DinB-like DNA polymerase)
MRIIAHLDMDAFFAAVEERDTPQWRGLPIVIGADPQKGKGRGVVSTANYKAREYGIKSALPINKAWQFSEWAKQRGEAGAIFIEPDIEKYERVSGEIIEIARSVLNEKLYILPERVRQSADESKAVRKTLRQAQGIRNYKIEQASIDEMYLDLSFIGSYEKARKVCQKIKKEIKKQEKLTCSIGIGPNKLIAKIASDFEKPDGLTIVEEKKVSEFLENMPIRKIPGIGPKTEIKLHEIGAVFIKDLKNKSLSELKEKFGKWGEDMFYKAQGIDDSAVEEFYEAKSIGEQETFPKDTREANYIIDRLGLMCENIIKRLKDEGFRNFRTIVITVRFAGFITKTRSHTLKKPASSLVELKRETIKLLMPFLDKRENPQMKKIRLVGARVEKLEQ